MILLAAGDWECIVRPEVGGCLAALRRGAIDILRPMPAASSEPLDSACFPLVPFCNRIAESRFCFGDRCITLRPNHPPEPHALHGGGWHSRWDLAASDASSARVIHCHDGLSGWPWAYRSEQDIRLDCDGLDIALQMTNLSAEAAPCGLGLHPYFRRSGMNTVRFTARSLLLSDPGLLPTGAEVPADTLAAWSAGAALPATTVDHCHAGWNGKAAIRDQLGETRLSASNAAYLHVYAPADGSALCLEPVSHRPDALNSCPADMIVLQPGETFAIAMRISA